MGNSVNSVITETVKMKKHQRWPEVKLHQGEFFQIRRETTVTCHRRIVVKPNLNIDILSS